MPKFRYSSDHEYDGYLKVNACGKQWFSDRDYDILIPKGRVDFSIRYVIKGTGYCEVDGEFLPCPEGSLMIHFPKSSQHFIYKKSDNCVILWVHFSGTVTETLTECLSKAPAIIKIQDRKQFESAFENMIISHYKKNDYSNLLCNGYTLALISLTAQSIFLANNISMTFTKNNSISKNEAMEKVISLMHENYNRPINIKEYAGLLFVGEDQFIRLFKIYTGFPPYNYQLQIRINRAVELLENTAITIRDCAETVGFDDPAYFSKVFKRFTGYPPSHFKKK